ncbi:MAG: YciI family protein [Acidothermaceae bacterium]
MYLMISTYLRPLDEVDAHRPQHFEFMAGLEAKGLVVGAGRRQPPTGGIVLLDVETEDEARAIFAADPYVVAGVAEYEPLGWTPTRGPLGNRELIAQALKNNAAG